MNIGPRSYRTLWWDDARQGVAIIDQVLLPHRFEIAHLQTAAEVAHAIRVMRVRGAPLIGVAGAWGVALAMREDPSDAGLEAACANLIATRPTAVNLSAVVERMRTQLRPIAPSLRFEHALRSAQEIADDDVRRCKQIGRYGAELIAAAWHRNGKSRSVQVLTHCNAGWLGTIDWGTALAPVYMAFDRGIDVHVWVDETRPRNQGAFLTTLELGWHGVDHTLIVDNAGGHLMQQGAVDLCIVGADRVTACGDVANKIGTYLKALAAHDNGLPFYVALPSATIDWAMTEGVGQIEIEERSASEVLQIGGLDAGAVHTTIELAPPGTKARNPGFDVTPARLVTAFITEHGVYAPSALGPALSRQSSTAAGRTGADL